MSEIAQTISICKAAATLGISTTQVRRLMQSGILKECKDIKLHHNARLVFSNSVLKHKMEMEARGLNQLKNSLTILKWQLDLAYAMIIFVI